MKGFLGFVTRAFVLTIVKRNIFDNHVVAASNQIDPHQILICMYGPSGDKDLELSSNQINLPYANDDFMLAAPDFAASYYGTMSGTLQDKPNIAYDFSSSNNIYNQFKHAGYTTGIVGYWPFSTIPKVQTFISSENPVNIFESAANFIAANRQNKFLLTVQLPRIDINFIPGVKVDSSIPCRSKSLPPWYDVCIEQIYGTSIAWGVNQTNELIAMLGNNATIVWFPAIPADDQSIHEYSDPRRSNRGLRGSLLGLEMPLRTNINIKYSEPITAIDIFPTLTNIAGIPTPNVDGINLQDPNAVRNKELSWFTSEPTQGKCLFNSPSYARIVNVNGVSYFQTWDSVTNISYLLSERFKGQPARISIPKPFQTNFSIPSCKVYPSKPLETFAIAPQNPKIISIVNLDDMNVLYQLLSLAPELQSVFDQGIVFNNFHGWIICSPSRAQILTGRSALDKKVGMFSVFSDQPNVVRPAAGMPKYLGARGKISFLPEFFSNNGRISILSGKHHVDGNIQAHSYYGWTPGYVKCYDCTPVHGQTFNQFDPLFPEQASGLIFNHSIQSTEQALTRGRNVFAYIGLKTMHIQIQVSPAGLQASNTTRAISSIPGTPQFNFPAPYRTQLALARIFAANFLSYIKYLESVAPNNYILVLTADNGPETRVDGGAENGVDSSSTLLGPHIDVKRGLGEGSHNVGAVIWGLGKKGVLNQLTSNMDLFPTLMAISGDTKWSPPDKNEFKGINLAPLIFSNDASALQNRTIPMERRGPEHTDFVKLPGRYTVLHSDAEGEWRLVLGSREEIAPIYIKRFAFAKLYNLRDDPAEMNDISDLRPDKVQELTGYLREYQPYSDNSFKGVKIPANAASQTCRMYRIGAPC